MSRSVSATRPRGFAAWTPRPDSCALLDQVHEVLATYRESLPLTGRQVFYRLVATRGYSKTEQAYKRLLELLNRARRAGLISMDDIRDDGAIAVGTDRFTGAADFLDYCRRWAETAEVDLLSEQPAHLEVLCEAAGMVPQLDRVARRLGVAVRSSGGFDSTTIKHQLGRYYAGLGKRVIVLHVGDHDPSGVHIASSLAEDLAAFAGHYGGEVELQRVAVTPEQQAAYALPTAPPKKTDKRSFESAFTVQAEALPPDALAGIVDAAIREHLDDDLLDEALQRQEQVRAELVSRLGGIGP